MQGLMEPVITEGTFVVDGDTPDGKKRYTIKFRWLTCDILLLENCFAFHPQRLVSIAETYGKWSGATVIGSVGASYNDKAHRDTDELTLAEDVNPRFKEFEAGTVLSVNAGAQIYKMSNEFLKVQRCTRINMLRYSPGQFFNTHVDVVKRDVQGDPLSTRELSYVGFLNNVEEGGELEFPRQRVVVQPAPGVAVVFPSGFTHPHRSLPVTKGRKYSLVAWMH